jgi:hypothetical protein
MAPSPENAGAKLAGQFSMSRQTGGDALAGQLAPEGVEVVFAVPGVLLDWAVPLKMQTFGKA